MKYSYRKLLEVVSQTLKIEQSQITDHLKPNDIESWDSLGHLKLITSIEEAFNIQFEFDEILELDCIFSIRKAVESKCQL